MVSYTPSEDPKYAFAVGRVRSREAKMLTRAFLERLIDSRDENQILSALVDTPYGEARAEDIETTLAFASKEEEEFFLRYLEDEKVYNYFRAPSLTANLKFALRRHYGADIDDALFVEMDSCSFEEYERMLAGEKNNLPQWIIALAGEVIAENYDNLEPASIDYRIDKALINYQSEQASGYSFLENLLLLKIDYTNLLVFLRLKLAGNEWEEVLERVFPNGSVDLDKFRVWWDLSPDAWVNEIAGVGIYSSLSDGLREVTESFILLERLMKDAELEFLLSTRRLTFGYEPLVGYVLIKREERRNIRRVLAGLRYNLEPETIRKSIAWFD